MLLAHILQEALHILPKGFWVKIPSLLISRNSLFLLTQHLVHHTHPEVKVSLHRVWSFQT